jgi:hypothetical protein
MCLQAKEWVLYQLLNVKGTQCQLRNLPTFLKNKIEPYEISVLPVCPSVMCLPLITFEGTGIFSWNSAGRSCHWWWLFKFRIFNHSKMAHVRTSEMDAKTARVKTGNHYYHTILVWQLDSYVCKNGSHMRFQVFTAVSVKVTAFWDIAPCSLVHRPNNVGSTNFWNVGVLQRDYTSLYPRRLPSSVGSHSLVPFLITVMVGNVTMETSVRSLFTIAK